MKYTSLLLCLAGCAHGEAALRAEIIDAAKCRALDREGQDVRLGS